MLERGKMDRHVIEIVGIDSLVPEEHLLRKIDKAVDFSRLYEMVEPLYCEDNGRPSVDPVVLFKMVLIQHLYGLPSLRRTAEEVGLNVAYRWFLGYTLQEDGNEQLPFRPAHGREDIRKSCFSRTQLVEKVQQKLGFFVYKR